MPSRFSSRNLILPEERKGNGSCSEFPVKGVSGVEKLEVFGARKAIREPFMHWAVAKMVFLIQIGSDGQERQDWSEVKVIVTAGKYFL